LLLFRKTSIVLLPLPESDGSRLYAATLLGRTESDPTCTQIQWFAGNYYDPEDTPSPRALINSVGTVSAFTLAKSLKSEPLDPVS
jgi:hypothetical protein